MPARIEKWKILVPINLNLRDTKYKKDFSKNQNWNKLLDLRDL